MTKSNSNANKYSTNNNRPTNVTFLLLWMLFLMSTNNLIKCRGSKENSNKLNESPQNNRDYSQLLHSNQIKINYTINYTQETKFMADGNHISTSNIINSKYNRSDCGIDDNHVSEAAFKERSPKKKTMEQQLQQINSNNYGCYWCHQNASIRLLYTKLKNLRAMNRNISMENLVQDNNNKIHQQSAMVATSRARRFIIFNDGGIVKLILGVSYPIQLVDRRRSLSEFYNIQLQYTPPPKPIYWWNLFDSNTFASSPRQKGHLQQWGLPPTYDASREFIYKAIATVLESKGFPGMACLLRIICEISQTPFYADGYNSQEGRNWKKTNGIFYALLNAIFIPIKGNVNEKYLKARQTGQYGKDCMLTFTDCPKNMNWLENISQFINPVPII